MPCIEADFQRELDEIEAESLGWIPLEPGVYLHVSDANADEVLVVGMANDVMQASTVLWLY
jgi:excinuclease UvrABC nuclease subunit